MAVSDHVTIAAAGFATSIVAALIGLFASRLTAQTMAGCVLGGEVVFFLAMELCLHWWRGRRLRVGEPA